MSLDSLV